MLTEKIRDLLKPGFNNKLIRDTARLFESYKYLDWRVRSAEIGNNLIYQAIMSGYPQAIGKIGSVELAAIRKYYRWHNHVKREELTTLDRQILFTNAGVFPSNYQTFEDYSLLMTQQILPELTMIAVWFNIGEANLVRRYAPGAARIALMSLESYVVGIERWTRALQGKKVLVVHPFEQTIHAQYQNRLQIWNGQEDILPEFELLTLKVPLSPALIPSRHDNWFAALADMQQQISAMESSFDVASIGAGAYSLPLAVHAKRMGKVGIHLGGALQLYFGIIGGRWQKNPIIQRFANEYWIRPLPEDTPAGKEIIEGGCYW